MRPTTEPTGKYATKLPARTDLRKTVTRTRAAIGGHAPNATVAVAALAGVVGFAATAAVLGFALALAVATLRAHPVALLTTAFVATLALYAVPLLTLRAVARAA